VRVDIDSPEGTLVALVCAETLAICAVPRADGVILGNGEDEVALLGEPVREKLAGVVQCGRWRRRRCGRMWFMSQGAYLLDLGEGTLVAGKQYGSHDCGCVVYWVVRGVLVITSSLQVRSAKFEAAEQRTQNDTNLASCEYFNSHRT
jgi:hypothetical protein